MPDHLPIGRFAPSPTGPLHHGSLLAAVASYLDIKSRHGSWLVRIEDVDSSRTVSGAADTIRHCLQAHGLQWDGDVVYQTDRESAYSAALQQLADIDAIFYCDCRRADLRQHVGAAYPGTCRFRRHATYRPATPQLPANYAVRLEVGDRIVRFDDALLGPQSFRMAELGDCVIRRRDSLFAYQLAVTIDDAWQGVSDIARGVDLLHSTPWQICLQQSLGLPRPTYMHLPLLVHSDGASKLSKQTAAPPVDPGAAVQNLCQILVWLGQPLPDAQPKHCTALLAWAVEHWSRDAIPSGPISITGG